MKEYLPQIGSRQKWYFRNSNLQVGDVVLIIDPGTMRPSDPGAKYQLAKFGHAQKAKFRHSFWV